MVRQILIEVALFLIPFVIYAAYLKIRGRDPAAAAAPIPMITMALIGLVLAILGLTVLVLTEDTGKAGTSGRYVPTHIEDGRLVPGHFEE